MNSKDLRNIASVYEAVYGKPKTAGQQLASREKNDNAAGAPMVVTNADKKANTKAYQNYKAGMKGYKAADHMKEQKKADKDYDGDGKVESGTDEYMGSRDKAIKKAMGKKIKEARWWDVTEQKVESELKDLKKASMTGKGKYVAKADKLVEQKKKKKSHHCATKVKHEEFGIGNPVKGMHDLDESGNVAHYDVLFDHGVEKNVSVSALEIIDEAMHEHVIRDNDGQEVLDESEVDGYIQTIQKIKRQEAEEDIKRWTALEESGNFTAEEMQTIKEQDIADLLARLEKKRISKGGNPDDSPLGKKVGRAMKSKQDEVRKKAGM